MATRDAILGVPIIQNSFRYLREEIDKSIADEEKKIARSGNVFQVNKLIVLYKTTKPL